MKLGLSVFGAVFALFFAVESRADDRLPVVIEYSAPAECASDDAFRALLEAQLARTPDAGRPWRFGVTIRRGQDYEGTLTFSSSERVLHAPTCDDLVAALTVVIAIATPPPLPPPPVFVEEPHTLEPPLPPPPIFVPRMVAPPRDVVEPPPDTSTALRIGARFQDWTNNGEQSAFGGTFVGSLEPQWGRYRMMFELAAGILETPLAFDTSPITTGSITWGVVDFQVCPLDLPLGSTGLSLLGCTRFAGAVTSTHEPTSNQTGGAIFVGGGGRLRWQSPWHLYVEAHVNGLWGTQSSPLSGSPAWADYGATVGIQI
jgi:hypothetical protein